MAVRRDIPLEEFSIIISPPSNRLESTSVNIYSDGKFNLNGKLTEKLGGRKIKIQYTQIADIYAYWKTVIFLSPKVVPENYRRFRTC